MYELMKHQKQILDLSKNSNMALFWDCGTGKTLAILNIFKEKQFKNPDLILLVICPLSLINTVWGEECKRMNLSFLPFKEIEMNFPEVVAINFESFIKEKYFNRIKDLIENNDVMVVVDESSRMKNNKSVTTKKILELSPKHRYVMSGTPMPNSEQELWGQMEFIKPGIFGSFYKFRNSFFYLERNGKKVNLHGQFLDRITMQNLFNTGWKYVISPSNREKMFNLIKPFVHWIKKEDVLDLPSQINQIREIVLNENERQSYNEMKRYLITEINGNEIVAQVALAKLMKLRQISSGFAYSENGSNLIANRIGNSKLNELDLLLEEIGKHQVIIWANFKAEFISISEIVMKHGLFTTLNGETKNKEENISFFQSGDVQYLIANPHSASHGLTFTNCSVQIFFSLDYSSESHIQAKDRIHRIGQTKSCLYIYLLAKNTIDEAIYKAIQAKQNTQELVEQILNESLA